MSLVIYKEGKPLRPWERYQEITDDYGNRWKAKMGNILEHHWALKAGKHPMLDHEGMSHWHIKWQNILEKVCGYELEKLKKDALGYRRADALNESSKAVVEVQYSSISESDFYERTKFWVNQGYRVIWIFDPKKYSDKTGLYEDQYRWSRQPVWWRAYLDFSPKVEIFIQNKYTICAGIRLQHTEIDVPTDKYYRIKSAFFMPKWRSWKYFCKTQYITKDNLISGLKGENK